MRRLFACFCLLALSEPIPAFANPILVKSGDHDGFTRLVMQLPDETQWEVTEAAGLKTISIEGHKDGFDIDRVFDVIPRDQLTNIIQYPSRLELMVSCDCEVKTFIESGSFLVVDILDGAPLELDRTESEANFTSLTPSSRFSFGELLWPSVDSTNGNERVPSESLAPATPGEETLSPNSFDMETAAIESTRDQLLKGVSNAASRGLLDPVLPVLEAAEKPQPDEQVPFIFDSSRGQETGTNGETGNLRISSSRDIPQNPVSLGLKTSGAVCASPLPVSVADWGDDRPFGDQLSELRDSLYSEIDTLDTDNVVKLARLYVYFGFGAEARQVLGLSDGLISSNPELMDLADIVDLGFARNPRVVHQFADCDSDLSLWALMAARTPQSVQSINNNAVLRALAKLPTHLRDFLAPIISKRFSELGKREAAAIALRRADFREGPIAPEAKMALAKIEENAGNAMESSTLIKQVAESNSSQSPEALIALVNNSLGDFSAIDADVALLIEAYSFELQGNREESEMFRAHVIASALSGQFSKAFQALHDNAYNNSSNRIPEINSYLFKALAKNANELEFLELYFAYFPHKAGLIDQNASYLVAKRLSDIGFPELSSSVLSNVSNIDKDTDALILEAELLLAMNNPRGALDILEEISGERVDELRARAHSTLGENQQASELYASIRMSEAAARSAWLADDWVELTPLRSPIFDTILSLAQAPIEPIKEMDGMIGVSKTAVQESALARESVVDFLQSVEISPQQ